MAERFDISTALLRQMQSILRSAVTCIRSLSLLSHIDGAPVFSNVFTVLSLTLFCSQLPGQMAPTEIQRRMEASIQRQKRAVDSMQASMASRRKRNEDRIVPGRKEYAADQFFTLPAAPVSAREYRPGCEALSADRVDQLAEQAGAEASISPQLVKAVMHEESAFYPCALSIKGAIGLMQLMPATASDLGVDNPFDPEKNVEAGAKFLKRLMDSYGGDLTLALSAYNAGPATVAAAVGVPRIPETLNYVNRILTAVDRADRPSHMLGRQSGNEWGATDVQDITMTSVLPK